MGYQKALGTEGDFQLKLAIAQKLHYNEVRKFIEKEGKEKFTLPVWDRIYKKYERLYSKINKEFADKIRESKLK